MTEAKPPKSQIPDIPYAERWSPANLQECIDLWNLTQEEQDKLVKFREQVKDIDHWKNDPFEVIRFLREFKFDLKVTEEKFRASIKWRLAHHADTILEEYTPPALYNYFPLGVLEGCDKDGDPIYIERSGAADTLGLLHRFGKDEMIQQAIWGKELMTRGPWQKQFGGPNRRVKYFTTILDLKGLNRHHLNPSLVPVGQAVTRLVQDNYCGLGKKILVIRAPTIFRFVWSIFKHFVDPHVKELIEIATEKETPHLLQQYMDLQVLPSVLAPPGVGQGRAVQGYEPVWEGGPLPPASKDDWKRGTPVYSGCFSMDPGGDDIPAEVVMTTPIKQSTTDTGEEEVEVTLEPGDDGYENDNDENVSPQPQTPIQPIKSGSTASFSSSSDVWEKLPTNNTAPKQSSLRAHNQSRQKPNIQQAWTVTPTPVYNLDLVWSKQRFNDMAELWQLKEVEKLYMQEFRDRIKDVQHWKNDPFEVVRFYREYNKGNLAEKAADLEKAEQAFRRVITWRVENDMDNFLLQYGEPNPLFRYMPMCMLRGTDKQGDPIFIDRIGSCDYLGLLHHFGGKNEEIVKYVTFIRELNSCRPFWRPFERHVLHSNGRVRQYTVIIDLEGLNMTQAVRPAMLHLLKRTSRISHCYSAGWVKRILIIRAPPLFKLVWGLVKGYFASHVRDLIEFSGRHHNNGNKDSKNNSPSYLALLDKYVDRAVLPSVICPNEGKGEGMPGYYEHVKLEGGPIPREAFETAKAAAKSQGPSAPHPRCLFTPNNSENNVSSRSNTSATGRRTLSAPMPPGMDDDYYENGMNPLQPPSSPVATRHLLMGTWGDEQDSFDFDSSQRTPSFKIPKEETIKAYASPEPALPFSSPMFKYNW